MLGGMSPPDSIEELHPLDPRRGKQRRVALRDLPPVLPRRRPLVALAAVSGVALLWAFAAGILAAAGSAMLSAVTTGTVAFISTNIDDLAVLTVLFLASAATGTPTRRQIWAGQYLGMAVLVAISALAAAGLSLVPDHWTGLLGLLPLALGVRGIVLSVRHRGPAGATADPDDDTAGDTAGDKAIGTVRRRGRDAAVATGLLAVIGITIANGGDNLSVYTPLFRTLGPAPTVLAVVIFGLLLGLWCAGAYRLGSHPRVVTVIRRFGRWLVPAVFLALGVFVIVSSGLLGTIGHAL